MTDVDRDFRKKICAAATRIAVAECFNGPVRADNKDEYLADIAISQRRQDEALAAMIEVVLFAKVHGDDIVASRATSKEPHHDRG